MSDIVRFGFAVDSSQLTAADATLEKMMRTAAGAEAAFNKLSATAASAFSKVSGAFGGSAGADPAASVSATHAAAAAQAGLAGATATSTTAIHGQAKALHGAAAAHGAHGAAAYANRLQMMELAHVGRALFDEMAAGGNIFRALAMEGGRLQVALSSGEGGLTGLLGRIGAGFTAIVNPAVLAATAIGTVTLAAGAAAISYENSQARLQRAVEGTGRASGVTAAQLRVIADGGAVSGNMGLGESRNIAAGFAQAGLPADMTAALLSNTPRFARFTDQDNASAGAALAGDFKDPVAGAKKLNDSLGFLNDRLLQTIEDMKASGDLEGARRVELEAFNAALKATKDQTWALGDAMREAKRWGGSIVDWVGKTADEALTGGVSKADQLKAWQSYLPNASDSPLAFGRYNRGNVQDHITRLQHELGTEVDPVQAAREQHANDLSLQAGPIIRSLLPEMVRAQAATNNLSLLRDALSDPMTLAALKMSPAAVSQAYGRESVMAANADPSRRARQDYDIRIAATGEEDVENKGLLDARRAELQVLRETGDVLRAATTAQMSLNEAIEAANAAAEDRARTARQNLGLVGLSPYERAMQEIRNKYDGPDGLIERDRFDKGGNNVLNDDDIKKDLTGPGSRLAAAIGDVSPKIEAAGNKLVSAIEGIATKVGSASPYGALTPFKPNDAVGPFFPVPFKGSAGPVSDNERTMVDMLVKAGFTNRAADAGYVGGMAGESSPGLDPTAHNASGHRGIEQWDASRFAGASSFGDPNAFLTQAQLAIHELQTSESAAGAMLRSATTIQGGLTANLRSERPAQSEIASSYSARLAYGTALGADLAGLTPRVDHTVMTIHGPGGIGAPTGPAPILSAAPIASAVAPIASTGAVSDIHARADNVAAVQKSYGSVPVDQATRSLQLQSASLATQVDMFGKTAAAAKGAAEAQQLWNKLAADGIVPVGELSKATGSLADRVRAYGADATKVAQQADDEQRRQQSIIGTQDAFRDDFSNVFTSGFSSAAQGQKFGTGAKNALHQIGLGLIGKGVSGITGGLFGQKGSPGGGLFGDLLGGLSHFAGGTVNAPGGPAIVGESGPELVQMPAHAQVMTASQTSALMGASKPSAPQFAPVTVHIHPVGGAQFTDEQIVQLTGHVQQGVIQGQANLMRNFDQFQRDAQQY